MPLAHRRTARRAALFISVAVAAVVVAAPLAGAVVVPWTLTSSASTTSDAEAWGVATFGDGTSVLAGDFEGSAVDLGDGLPRTSSGGGTGPAGMVERLGADGRVQWVRTFVGGAGSSVNARPVAARSDGASVTGGWFTGASIDFGDGVPRTSAANGANRSAFVAGLRADGSVSWAIASTAPAQPFTETYMDALSATADGGVIATGDFSGVDVDLGDGVLRTSGFGGSPGNWSGYVQAITPDGAIRWTRTTANPGPGQVSPYGVTTRPDGTALTTGYFTGAAVDLGDGTPRASAQGGSSPSAYVQALSSSGVVLWTTTSSASTFSQATGRGISALPDSGAIVVGRFSGVDVDLGDGVAHTSGGGGADTAAYTQRIRGDGSVVWTRVTTAAAGGGVGTYGVSTLPDGSSLAAGDFEGTNVDLGDGVLRSSPPGSSWTSFVQKRAGDGTVTWTHTSSAPMDRSSSTSALAVSAQPDGSSVAGGFFKGVGVDLGDGAARTSAASGARTSLFAQQIIDVSLPPAAPVATAGNAKASVAITPLAGGVIHSYEVVARPGGARCTITAPATDCVVQGLANGTPYAFTATAANAAGASAESAASNTVTPTAPARTLVALVVPARTRIASGQAIALGIGARNAGTSAAAKVTACTTLPANLVLVGRNGARRRGRTLCVDLGDLAAGKRRTKSVTVRAVSTRAVRRTLVGTARSVSIAGGTSRSRPVTIRIVPSGSQPVVTG